MSSELVRHKRSLLVLFFIPGLAFASWVTRTPEIRNAIDASVAEMGIVLFGLSIGSITGVLGAGRVVNWFGTKFAITSGLGLVCLSMLTLAGGVALESQLLAATGLALFGLGIGTAEIAVNIDGAEVERRSGKHVLHLLHGAYSLGTLTGALIGLAMTALQVSPIHHLFCIALMIIVLIICFQGGVPAGAGKITEKVILNGGSNVWRDSGMLALAFLTFSMAMAEGAASDWLPILVVDEHGFSSTAGSLAFVGFAAAMTVGRLSGGFLLKRFTIQSVVQACALSAAAGLLLIAVANNDVLIYVAIILWGAGASLGFPLALSWAGQGGGDVARRVKALATVGYIAVLVAPPSLGLIGGEYGLRIAMLIVMVMVMFAIPICRQRAPGASERNPG